MKNNIAKRRLLIRTIPGQVVPSSFALRPIIVVVERTPGWDIAFPTYIVGSYKSRNAAKRALLRMAKYLNLCVDNKVSIATTNYGNTGDLRVLRLHRNDYRSKTGAVVIDGISRVLWGFPPKEQTND